MMGKRRSNLNAIYCILLGISLVAIIIVAVCFLIKETKNNNIINEQSGSDMYVEQTTAYIENQPTTEWSTDVIVPTESVTVPTTAAPVQMVQEYDINGDGVSESVNVTVGNKDASSCAIIDVGGIAQLEVVLEPIGFNMQRLAVVGLSLKNEKRLAAIESVYVDGGMGVIKCHVWKYENNAFVKTSEILYSGTIGDKGFMDRGLIENRVPQDSFSYNAEEHMNGYIYERSRAIADMKDIGIKFPFETVGAYTITYDDNVTFFYDMYLQ